MKARKWANPMCTRQMIFECDKKIKEHRLELMSTEEGREKMMKGMHEMWKKCCPSPDQDTLGFDDIEKMMTIMNPEIDKINAPHTDAHWNWDMKTIKPIWDLHVKIFGMGGRYSLP